MDRRRMKPWLQRALLLFLTFAIATFALRYALRDLDWPTFVTQVAALDWRWLALAVLFDIASYVAQGLRWRILLQHATVWQTTRAIYAGLFLNELIPFRPGEAVRAWLAARDLRTTIWQVLPSIVAERLMDGFWLAGCLLLALWLAPLSADLASIARKIVLIVSAIIVIAAFLSRLGAHLRSLTKKLANPSALLVSGGFLASQGLAFWSVDRASHLSLGVRAAFVVMLVVRIGTMLPGAPANIGVHQLSTVLGLSLYGVTGSRAASFSVVVFMVLTVPLCILGLMATIASGVTWRRVRESLTFEWS